LVTTLSYSGSFAYGQPLSLTAGVAAQSSKHFRTDVPATPTPMSRVASDAVFASHRSATVPPADVGQSAPPWAWLAAIESSWNSLLFSPLQRIRIPERSEKRIGFNHRILGRSLPSHQTVLPSNPGRPEGN